MLGQKLDHLRGRRPGLNIPPSSKWKHCWHHNMLFVQPAYHLYGVLKMGKVVKRKGGEWHSLQNQSSNLWFVLLKICTVNKNTDVNQLAGAASLTLKCSLHQEQIGFVNKNWRVGLFPNIIYNRKEKKNTGKLLKDSLRSFFPFFLFLNWVTVAWASSPSLTNQRACPQQCVPLLRVLRDNSQSSSAHPYVNVLHNSSVPAQQWAMIAG